MGYEGRFAFNDADLMERLGYKRSELSSLPLWLGKIPNDNVISLFEQVGLHIKSHAEIPFAQEVCFLHKNKPNRYYVFTGAIVEWRAQNEPLLMRGAYLDISKQKETEKELLKAKDFLIKTNKAGKVGGWEIDMDSLEVTWTVGTSAIFGLSDNFKPSKDNFIQFFKEGPDRVKLEEAFQAAITEGKSYDLQLRVINTRGKEIWTRSIGQPEFEGGRCKRVYGIFQDINRQKRDEGKNKDEKAPDGSFYQVGTRGPGYARPLIQLHRRQQNMDGILRYRCNKHYWEKPSGGFS